MIQITDDQVPNGRHLRVQHTYGADDDPRAPIQQSFGDKFRQHDGVVTMMMFYRRRASPKLRDDMTEVDYGEGGHRTRLETINLSVLGCPLPPYIKEQGGRPAGPCRARQEEESSS